MRVPWPPAVSVGGPTSAAATAADVCPAAPAGSARSCAVGGGHYPAAWTPATDDVRSAECRAPSHPAPPSGATLAPPALPGSWGAPGGGAGAACPCHGPCGLPAPAYPGLLIVLLLVGCQSKQTDPAGRVFRAHDAGSGPQPAAATDAPARRFCAASGHGRRGCCHAGALGIPSWLRPGAAFADLHSTDAGAQSAAAAPEPSRRVLCGQLHLYARSLLQLLRLSRLLLSAPPAAAATAGAADTAPKQSDFVLG